MACLLDGIRVLDLTNVLAGPFCCYQLAQLGAEVVKVEQPGKGDLARQLGGDPAMNAQLMGTSFLAQNAGKRSITVNLKSPDGRAVFERLVETADVVVENYRPGVMERLGLSYDALRAIHPGIVYCAISGYGKSGPMAGNPAYDQIIQGLSGVMSVTGDAATAPLRVGYPVCDTIGGLSAAFAIAAALYRKRVTGAGEMIDVSMLEATLGTMGWTVSNWLMAGHAPRPMGNQNMTAAPSGTFATGDGLLNIAANKQDQFERLCALIERPDLMSDPRFREREARKRNRDALTLSIEDALSTRAAADWAALFNAEGIPAGEVLTVPQILAHEQIEGRNFVHNFDDPRLPTGRVGVVRAGFRLASGDPRPSSPPPELGADTEALLDELGYGAAARTELRAAGAV